MTEKLGFAHPRYLLAKLTSRDVAEWQAYYQVEAEIRAQEDSESRVDSKVKQPYPGAKR